MNSELQDTQPSMTVEEVRGSLDLTDNGAIKNSIPSLVKICDAFQITLSEFFAKAEGNESAPVVLTPQQMQVIDRWSVLRPDQQEAVLSLLNTIP